jgi:hypothetical protein
MLINTWINDALVTIDVEAIWAETFAHWDALVDTDTASKIATATQKALRDSQKPTKPTKPVDTAAMSEKELFAYYKRTHLAADLAFFLQFRMSDALRARAQAITKPTKQDINALRDAWGVEREREERAAGVPHVGSEAWRIAEGISNSVIHDRCVA